MLAALSCPRGSGKSWLAGRLIARSISPGDALFEAATENILVAASRAQAGITLEFAREALGEAEGYRWSKDGVIHVESRARVRVISSDSRRALGLGAHVRLIVCEEPAAWFPTSGRRLWDAMLTSLGKRKTQIIAIGTLAPAALTGPASWWPSFVASGSGDGRHVSLLQADPEKWTDFDEVLRVNPVAAINPHLKRTLEREHAAALSSERTARTFRQYRLNLPGDPVGSTTLNHVFGMAKGRRALGPGVRGVASRRDRSRRYEVVDRRECSLAIWSNRGVGGCTWSSGSGRPRDSGSSSRWLLCGVGPVWRAIS